MGEKNRLLFPSPSSSVDFKARKRGGFDSYKQAALTSPLQDERQDGRAERRVVSELLQVAAVLPLCPNGHLDEAHQSKEGHWQTLGHEGETKPGAQLIGVVGTGDQQKDPGEGVLGWIGNLPGLRAWWTKVPKSNVDGEVADLTEQEYDEGNSYLLLPINGWRI